MKLYEVGYFLYGDYVTSVVQVESDSNIRDLLINFHNAEDEDITIDKIIEVGDGEQVILTDYQD